VIKVLGIYSLSRIFLNVLGASGQVRAAFIVLGVISMVVASFLAVGQTDLKRLLAYSSVSQIGYIVLGLGTANPIAVTGALFHLFNHSLFKSLLFLNSGAIEALTGSRDIRRIKGVMKKSPAVGYTNLIGTLSISGMPPFGGFWSKLLIILGCIQSGHFAAGAIAVGVGILTLVYYFKAMTPVLFGRDGSGDTQAGVRLSPAIYIPILVLAVLCVFSGLMLLPNFGNQLLKNAASLLCTSGEYLQLVNGVIRP